MSKIVNQDPNAENNDGTEVDADQLENAEVVEPGAGEDADVDAPVEGEDALGDAGKKALRALKDQLKEARKNSRGTKSELEALKAQIANAEAAPDEQKINEAVTRATSEATAKANERILKSEVRAAAGSKLKDPKDALRFIDLSQFEADDNGDFDSEEIAEAIADLIADKPYLASAAGSTTTFDTGKGKKPVAKKLTAADLEKMTPAQIAKAYDAGQVQF